VECATQNSFSLNWFPGSHKSRELIFGYEATIIVAEVGERLPAFCGWFDGMCGPAPAMNPQATSSWMPRPARGYFSSRFALGEKLLRPGGALAGLSHSGAA